ncbi:MAG TPA: endoflagellar protein [Chloroflexi bacterium]|nr:endoflagellar protein [Chloroflexota bacterium]
MIKVTRLNGKELYINAEMIRMVEGTPDSVITLTDNTKVIVREPPEEIVARVIAYRQKARQGLSGRMESR